MAKAAPDQNTAADLTAILESAKPHSTTKRIFRWLIAVAVLAIIAIAVFYWRAQANKPRIHYETQDVSKGNLVVTVSATGNVKPTNQVDVGSELSGTVEQVFVDDNDHVQKGQTLAVLDLSKLNDALARSRSALVADQARVQQAQATLQESRANLDRLQRVQQLSGGKVPSAAEMDTAKAAFARAEADQASARAVVAQDQAQVRSDQTNIQKATIKSPIDGVVLVRNVEPGQTVAASLQAPVLFTLAENLAQMQIEVQVDEADVGSVSKGQSATFTVDAYPNRHYKAIVDRVSYGSKTEQGVVSYPTILLVNNDDLSLRPGMTASALIRTATREDVLLVPNAALRFIPQTNSAAQNRPQASGNSGSLVQRLVPRFRQNRSRAEGTGFSRKSSTQRIYVLEAGKAVPLTVQVGLSDGKMTEIQGGNLKEGMKVITEAVTTQKSS
jgi:HlyD family secretion protein